MDTQRLWVGLDAAVSTTSVCILDDSGRIEHEEKCATDPDVIGNILRNAGEGRISRVCIEAGAATSVVRVLRREGFPVQICEVKRSSKFLSIRRQKTDANDAAGLADLGRLGGAVLKDVHLKSLECQNLRTRLSARQRLLRMRKGCDGLIQSMVRLYGGDLKLRFANGKLAADVEPQLALLAAGGLDVENDVRPLIDMSEGLRTQLTNIDKRFAKFSEEHPVCRRFRTVPGVGPITAISFYSAIEDPSRFPRVRDVGPYLGLTPSLMQSGSYARQDSISRMGNRMTRTNLVSAATVLLSNSKTDCALKRWGEQLSDRRGRGKARVAVARKLAVLLLHLWKTGKDFDPDYGAN